MLAILRRWLELDSGEAAALVRRMFDAHPTKHFAVRLWDGTEVRWDRNPEFTIRFPDPDAFFDCFRSADPACFAEAYADDRLHVDGDLRRAVELASYLGQIHLGLREKLRVVPRLAVASSNHSRERDARDVRTHYDLSDDFFRLFLDRRMVYSCAYFAHPDQTLEEAQERKLELVCRKLDLRPGEQYLDIGCGWGALPLWAAERHAVHAHGITLSPNQLGEARRRVAGAGLGDRVELALAHYGELPDDRFDKISSFGKEGLQEALAELRKARVRNAFERCQMHLFAAQCHLFLKEPEAANREFEKAFEADRGNVYAMIRWARNSLHLAIERRGEGEPTYVSYVETANRIALRALDYDVGNDDAKDILHTLATEFPEVLEKE